MRVLFIYKVLSSFVKKDLEILSQDNEVVEFEFVPVHGVKVLGQFLKQFIYLIFNGHKYDAFYIWFADDHAFLPALFSKLFGKKSFLVIGGYDSARDIALNYGVFVNKIRGVLALQAMKWSSVNIAVSNHVLKKINAILSRTDNVMIHNCVSLDYYSFSKKPDSEYIITIAKVSNKRTLLIKGIDTFLQLANRLPTRKFKIIGLEIDKIELKKLGYFVPENVTIYSGLPHNELVTHLMSSKIYCQFSRQESFGLSVAESVAYGCIPIVTRTGGLTEVVGDFGYYVPRDVARISEIVNVISDKPTLSIEELHRQQKYINNKFGVRNRSQKLIELIFTS